MSIYGCKKTETLNSSTAFEVPDRINKVIKERIESNFENKVYLAKFSLNEPTQYKFYGASKKETALNKDRFCLILWRMQKESAKYKSSIY